MCYYHYTNLNAFKSIIENKELWAFNFIYMNDREEFKFLIKSFSEYVDQYQGRSESHYGKILEGVYDKLIKKASLTSYFIISFSKNGDQLSQWRGYANNGSGVSIGFECKNKINLIDYEVVLDDTEFDYLKSLAPSKFQLIKVIYSSSKNTNSFFDKYYERMESHFMNKFPPNTDYGSIEVDKQEHIYANDLWFLALGAKANGFYEEEEYRLIRYEHTDYNRNYEMNFLKNELFFKDSDNYLKSFVKFPYEDLLSLRKIILGPKYMGDVFEIENFVKKNNLNHTNILIEESKIPYK